MRKQQDRSTTRVTILVRAACVTVIAGALLTGCASSSMQDSEGREFVHGASGGCALLDEESVPSDDPDIDLNEGVFRCRDEMSDPRVTGWVDWTLDPYYVHYTTDPETGRFEGSPVLTPDERGGTWRGTGFGVDIWNDDGLATALHDEYVGEGQYEELVYRQ
jgi:hypothetical protein